MNKKIKKLFAFAALTTTGIYFINRALNYTATLKNLVNDDHGLYYGWKNGDVYYTVSGKGSPVLLIHDLHPASSLAEWSKMVKKLEKEHQVFCVDLPGCGRSDKPAITYTNYFFVQFVNDFIRDIIGEKTTVVATGASGSFTIMAKAMNPENFENVILINPESLSALAKQPDKCKLAYKHLLDCPIFGTFAYNVEMHEKNINRLFEEVFYSRLSLISTKMEDIYFESAHIGNGTGRFLLSSIRANYTNISISHVLPKMDHLYLIGCRDLPGSISIMDEYKQKNDSIDVGYVSHAKYLPQLEVPDKLYDTLHMFLA